MYPEIKMKRIYDLPDAGDGWRVLVDRLWPRGIKKENAKLDEWAKELAPSTEIRITYGHQPERWSAFKQLYVEELKENEHISTYLEKWEDKKVITLLFASKDPLYTHALILQQYLQHYRR